MNSHEAEYFMLQNRINADLNLIRFKIQDLTRPVSGCDSRVHLFHILMGLHSISVF